MPNLSRVLVTSANLLLRTAEGKRAGLLMIAAARPNLERPHEKRTAVRLLALTRHLATTVLGRRLERETQRDLLSTSVQRHGTRYAARVGAQLSDERVARCRE